MPDHRAGPARSRHQPTSPTAHVHHAHSPSTPSPLRTRAPSTPSTFNDSQPSTTKSPRRSKRSRLLKLFRRWKALSVRHTWLSPLVFCLLVVGYYLLNPRPSNPVSAALFLSYPLSGTAAEEFPLPPEYLSGNISTEGWVSPVEAAAEGKQLYGKGPRDFAFVAFYTVVLTFTREFLMQRLLRPMAIRAGLRSRAKQSRFMEQTYTAIYFVVMGPVGLWVMSRTPVWYFSTQGMFAGYPHRAHEALVKGYYLFQASYWAQQMIVMLLMQEKPRKDFRELVAHHVLTLALIGLSYRFHFTYTGLAVYLTHDISDFFLATSKTLNYLNSSFIVPYFLLFIGIWTYLRHFINLRILISLLPLPSPFPDHINTQILHFASQIITPASSILTPIWSFLSFHFSTLFPHISSQLHTLSTHITTQVTTHLTTPSQFATIGPYALDWATQQYKCWISQWITFLLLAALQAVNLFWLFLIFRILWRVVRTLGREAEDVRSEYDSEDEVEAEERKREVQEFRLEVARKAPPTAGATS